MAAGTARAHLENCTGKRERERSDGSGRQQSEAEVAERQIRGSSRRLNSLRNGGMIEARSSEEERRVDAKALIADEGRDKLRKAMGSCK